MTADTRKALADKIAHTLSKGLVPVFTVHDYRSMEHALRATSALSPEHAALAPFAKLAESISENHRDNRPVLYGLEPAVLERLTIGDLRKARAAYVASALPPGPLKAT